MRPVPCDATRPRRRPAGAGWGRAWGHALAGLLLSGAMVACTVGPGPPRQEVVMDETTLAEARARMVRTQIEARGVLDPRVLAAMREVPRHRFVPDTYEARAYDDTPLPIAAGQTISQPYIVAVMSAAAEIEPDDVVLEIGTGSGYQAAVLSHLARSVYSIEVVETLAETARQLLQDLGRDNVTVRYGDGYAGWPEQAPFDAIVVTAAPPAVPEALKAQLKVGGRLVVPVGEFDQDLRVITRTPAGYDEQTLMGVRFVPMVKGRRN